MILNKFQPKPFYALLNSSEIKKIKDHSLQEGFYKNDTLFIQGEEILLLYIISSGWIRLCKTTFEGQEASFGLATEGDILGGANLDHLTYPFTAHAISDGSLIKIKYNKFQEIINNDSNIALKFLFTLGAAINNLELQVEQSFTMNASQRIGCFIIKLNDNKNCDEITLNLPFEKGHIASYLNMKRETFSRGLKELQKIGVMIKKNTVYVPEMSALIKHSCIGCSLFSFTNPIKSCNF